MRNLLNPKWLFIINTLPLVVLFFLFFGQFNIIKTLLEENSIQLWKSFSLSLGVLGLLNFAYAVYLTLKNKDVSVWFGLIAYPYEGRAVDVCIMIPASDGPKVIQTGPTIMAGIVGSPYKGLGVAITL